MAENMLSNRPETGRTFPTAMWVIGGIAAFQLFGVVWAVMKRPAVGVVAARVPSEFSAAFPPMPLTSGGQSQPGEPTAGVVNNVGADEGGGIPVAPSGRPFGTGEGIGTGANAGGNLPIGGIRSGVVSRENGAEDPRERGVTPVKPISSGEPVLAEPSFVGPATSNSESLSDSLTEASFSAGEIADPIIERLISTGVELRSADNMQGALQALKEAEAAMPEHPRIMSELGATYRQMGLDEKADGYWGRVEALGEIGGGAYYAIARRQLRGEVAPEIGDANQIMKIDRVKVDEQPPDESGQQVSARIAIKADPATRPDGEKLSVLVYFYDDVDGSRLEPSTANTSYLYPTEPYDWQVGGTEEIIVNYSQPVFTEEQRRELGQRKYFGYVIELYYRDQLQDRVVMPEVLEKIRLESPSVSPEEPGRIEPENALFPAPSGL